VLGIKDLELGEKIIAILCLRPEFNTNDVSVIHKEMDEHLATRLVKYKQPRKYVLADHLPRNHLGKVRNTIFIFWFSFSYFSAI
jgi:acyl-CoA synthetase (AMP-forming)/AMP-acid ligase II